MYSDVPLGPTLVSGMLPYPYAYGRYVWMHVSQVSVEGESLCVGIVTDWI